MCVRFIVFSVVFVFVLFFYIRRVGFIGSLYRGSVVREIGSVFR